MPNLHQQTADDRRTTPYGMWRYGNSYLFAAKTLDAANPNPRFTSDVTHQCVCQGIELAFKSYILANGKSLNDLKVIGHSLLKCMNVAVALGMSHRSADHLHAIEMMDHYYSEHEFRYIVTGSEEFPIVSRLFSVGAYVLYDAAPSVAEAMDAPDLLEGMRLGLSADFGENVFSLRLAPH